MRNHKTQKIAFPAHLPFLFAIIAESYSSSPAFAFPVIVSQLNYAHYMSLDNQFCRLAMRIRRNPAME